MVKRNRIAIIPARGGSKRIERKNVVDFLGRPMIAWTIEAALETGAFDRIIVSTDDVEIAEASRRLGAEVPFLRDANADDITPVSAATIGTLAQVEAGLDETYDVVVQLMANCPLRRAEHVTAALERFQVRRPESQISCFRFGWMNPWWAVTVDADGHPAPLHPQALTQRSQDLPTLFCPTGAIWISTSESLRRYGTFHTPAREYAEIPWRAALDIDDHEDLSMARAIAQAGKGS